MSRDDVAYRSRSASPLAAFAAVRRRCTPDGRAHALAPCTQMRPQRRCRCGRGAVDPHRAGLLHVRYLQRRRCTRPPHPGAAARRHGRCRCMDPCTGRRPRPPRQRPLRLRRGVHPSARIGTRAHAVTCGPSRLMPVIGLTSSPAVRVHLRPHLPAAALGSATLREPERAATEGRAAAGRMSGAVRRHGGAAAHDAEAAA